MFIFITFFLFLIVIGIVAWWAENGKLNLILKTVRIIQMEVKAMFVELDVLEKSVSGMETTVGSTVVLLNGVIETLNDIAGDKEAVLAYAARLDVAKDALAVAVANVPVTPPVEPPIE